MVLVAKVVTDALTDYVMHQRVSHERSPTESFQGIMLKYSGGFSFFSTKMHLNCLRLEIPSRVGARSNVRIMTR